MTEKQKDLLGEMFTRYGSPCKESNETVHFFYQHPAELKVKKRIEDYNDRASRDIKRLQDIIEQLKAYQVALYERYNELESAHTVKVVKLIRRKDYWDNKVYYNFIICERNMQEKFDVEVKKTVYTGKERHEAIKAFNAYVADHPEIVSEKDIEKR